MNGKSSNDREDVEHEFFRRFKIAIEFLTELGKLEEYNKRIGMVWVLPPQWQPPTKDNLVRVDISRNRTGKMTTYTINGVQ